MAIVTLASHVTAISGSFGDLTYVPLGDRQILRRKGKKGKRRPAQDVQPNRVRAAAAYWRSMILPNPELMRFYSSLPHVPSMGAYQFFLRDFMHAPTVEEIDTRNYSGRAGDRIQIQAADDSGVVTVRVQVIDMNGGLIEEGAAALEASIWIYVATKSLAAGKTVSIKATAKDRPGNTGTRNCLAYVP